MELTRDRAGHGEKGRWEDRTEVVWTTLTHDVSLDSRSFCRESADAVPLLSHCVSLIAYIVCSGAGSHLLHFCAGRHWCCRPLQCDVVERVARLSKAVDSVWDAGNVVCVCIREPAMNDGMEQGLQVELCENRSIYHYRRKSVSIAPPPVVFQR